ncbi:MAG: hypothetical protein WBB08_08235 [Halobacteriota archaeon]
MNTKNSKKIISTTVFAAIIVFSMLAISTAPASAATKIQIEDAISDGLNYLIPSQNADGSWGASDKAAVTGLVLLKLQDHARELRKDPYDNDPTSPTYYVYADNVIAGMNYMLSKAYVVPIGMQTNCDPDSNGNGQGIVFKDPAHDTYTTGIALCALGVSNLARTYNIGGTDYTYAAIAQDAADWLAYAQVDAGTSQGGWYYTACDNCSSVADNSNSGYAALGLAYAESAGCTVPQCVKDELDIWINTIQDPFDGGSWYQPGWSWVNTLKTGNLLQQMALCGDTYPDSQRVLDAKHYLERHWQDANQDPGWGYSLAHPDTQAMFTIMKGLTNMGIDLIDTDGDGVQDNDWFNQEPSVGEDFASALVDTQNGDGSWSNCAWGGSELCTAWALLTLEKIGGQPPDPWKEINKELDALIGNVSNATMPNIIKQRLVDKLVYAKELKDNAHEECLADNFIGATKKLGVAENQVESFASMVKITRRITPEDKASFLADATEIIGKIEKLIEHIETTDSC